MLLDSTKEGSVRKKKYQCSDCKHTTDQKSHLTSHHRTHSGVKPFQCSHDGCSAKFTTPGNLKVHARIHKGAKPYECSSMGCTYRIAVASNVKKHCKRKHQVLTIMSKSVTRIVVVPVKIITIVQGYK